MVSLENSTKPHKKELIPIFFQKIEMLPKSVYKASIIHIPKPDKDHTKKEDYRPMFLININTYILKKTLTSRIQQYMKIIITKTKLGLFQEWNAGLIVTNQAI